MLYVDFQAGTKEYKLRLTTRAVVALEKTIGCNPLMIFGNGDNIPTVTTMVSILHASLQHFHHGITLLNAYDIFDEYLENHSLTDFIPVIMSLYKQSGLIKEDNQNAEQEEKN